MTSAQSTHLKALFFEHFRRHGNVYRSCEAIGVPRRTIYLWREKDPKFAACFAEAEIEATEHMESEAYRRAVEGVEKPVYQGGKKVGVVSEYSDVLLIFMLKARDPDKYRENVRTEITGVVGIAAIPIKPVDYRSVVSGLLTEPALIEATDDAE